MIVGLLFLVFSQFEAGHCSEHQISILILSGSDLLQTFGCAVTMLHRTAVSFLNAHYDGNGRNS